MPIMISRRPIPDYPGKIRVTPDTLKMAPEVPDTIHITTSGSIPLVVKS